MKRIFVLLVFVYACFLSYSQADFRNGLIIKNNTDTIYGLIDYRRDVTNSISCRFKLDDSSKAIVYSPEDILGYRYIDDKFYISKEIENNNINEKRFLEFLLHGVINLYCFKEADETRFYIEKPGLEIIELKQKDYEYYKNNKKYQGTIKEYLNSLDYVFNDVPEFQEKIKDVTLDKKSLIKITEEYHNNVCKDYSCVIYEKKLSRFKMNLGLLSGINTINLENSVFYYSGIDLYGGLTFYCDFEQSVHPALGAYVNIPFVNSNDRFSVQYENIFNNNKISSYYVSRRYGNKEEFSVEYMTLHNNIFFKYNLLKYKVRPFIQIGGLFDFNYFVKYKGDDYYNPFTNHTNIGLIGGVGLAYKITEKRELFVNLLFSKNYDVLNYFNSKEISVRVGIPIIAL